MSHHDHHHGPMEYSSFGFIELWRPELLLLTVAAAVLYLWLVDRGARRWNKQEQVSFRQKVSFLSGLAVFYIAKGTPINVLGHHFLFSAHMTQMSFMYLIMPPLLLLGSPAWLLRPLFELKYVRAVLTFCTKPLFAILGFNIAFTFYHLPLVFDTVWTTPWLHSGYHIVLIFVSFCMWWPVVCPIPERNSMSSLKKMGYIFLNGVLLTPACALIIFASTPMYDAFSTLPQMFTGLSHLEDQQLGGVIMKLVQEFVYGGALAYIFFHWYNQEREKDADDLPDQAGLNRA